MESDKRTLIFRKYDIKSFSLMAVITCLAYPDVRCPWSNQEHFCKVQKTFSQWSKSKNTIRSNIRINGWKHSIGVLILFMKV